eukprot:gene38841-47965_t
MGEHQHRGVLQAGDAAVPQKGAARQKVAVAVHEVQRTALCSGLQLGADLGLEAARVVEGVVAHPDFKNVAEQKDGIGGCGLQVVQACGITGLQDPTVLSFAGQRYLLSHGDLLCIDDTDYQRFRVQARSPAWQQQFLSQPLATRRTQARGIRQESEARKQSGAIYADVDHASAIAWLQAAGAHTLIHGHTHRPADHALAPGLQRVVLSDWDAAALPPRLETLRLSAAGLERVALAPMYQPS